MEQTLYEFYKKMSELNKREKTITEDEMEAFYKEKNALAYDYMSFCVKNSREYGKDENVVISYNSENDFYYDKIFIDLPNGERFTILPITVNSYEQENDKNPVVYDFIKNNIDRTLYQQLDEDTYNLEVDYGPLHLGLDEETHVHFNDILPDELKVTKEKVNEKMNRFIQMVIENNVLTREKLYEIGKQVNENIEPINLKLDLFAYIYKENSRISTNFGNFECDNMKQFVNIINNIKEHEIEKYFENVDVSEENIENTLKRLNVDVKVKEGLDDPVAYYSIYIDGFTILDSNSGSRYEFQPYPADEYKALIQKTIDENKVALMAVINSKETFASFSGFYSRLVHLTKEYNETIGLGNGDIDVILKNAKQKTDIINALIVKNKDTLQKLKKIFDKLPQEKKDEFLKDDFNKELIDLASQTEINKEVIKE